MPVSDPARRTDGGAPLLGEPLPVELANTIFRSRDGRGDGLGTPGHLAGWLAEVRPRLDTPLSDQDLLAIGPRELAAARELRDNLRALVDAAVNQHRPDPAALATLNRYAHAAVRWHELSWDAGPRARPCFDGPAVTAALTEIAQAGVDLFAGPRRAELRICDAPGCVLFFVRDHPRRTWCSNGCGNRVRAARHYSRVRLGGKPDPTPESRPRRRV
ncbi:MAG TPA: ABATE domain-containing protein [Mycobacteriales bacterium]